MRIKIVVSMGVLALMGILTYGFRVAGQQPSARWDHIQQQWASLPCGEYQMRAESSNSGHVMLIRAVHGWWNQRRSFLRSDLSDPQGPIAALILSQNTVKDIDPRAKTMVTITLPSTPPTAPDPARQIFGLSNLPSLQKLNYDPLNPWFPSLPAPQTVKTQGHLLVFGWRLADSDSSSPVNKLQAFVQSSSGLPVKAVFETWLQGKRVRRFLYTYQIRSLSQLPAEATKLPKGITSSRQSSARQESGGQSFSQVYSRLHYTATLSDLLRAESAVSGADPITGDTDHWAQDPGVVHLSSLKELRSRSQMQIPKIPKSWGAPTEILYEHFSYPERPSVVIQGARLLFHSAGAEKWELELTDDPGPPPGVQTAFVMKMQSGFEKIDGVQVAYSDTDGEPFRMSLWYDPKHRVEIGLTYAGTNEKRFHNLMEELIKANLPVTG